MPEINAPAVIAELTALHDAYEAALAAHDVARLNTFFWASPHTVRFGVNEHLYGADAVAAYRQSTAPGFTERQLLRRTLLALGDDTASVMCEISQRVAGQLRHSRQSQVWVRFPIVGWRIVSAHVSNLPAPATGATAWDRYVEQTAGALQLPLDPAHRPGVVQSFERLAAIAAPLLAFPVPEPGEPAPVFTP